MSFRSDLRDLSLGGTASEQLSAVEVVTSHGAADQVLRTGVQITSDYPITVVYDIITRATQFFNPETYSLKGQNGMGYEFVCPFQLPATCVSALPM